MRILNTVAGALALVAATPVTAQDAAPDEATIAAAERLLDATDYDELMRDMTAQMIATQQARLAGDIEARTGTVLDPELIDTLNQLIAHHLEDMLLGNLPELRRASALIYAKYMSEEDLDRVATLQADPAMKRFNAQLPAMTSDILNLTQDIAIARQPALREDILNAIAEYEARTAE